jgi:hypothetical protein
MMAKKNTNSIESGTPPRKRSRTEVQFPSPDAATSAAGPVDPIFDICELHKYPERCPCADVARRLSCEYSQAERNLLWYFRFDKGFPYEKGVQRLNEDAPGRGREGRIPWFIHLEDLNTRGLTNGFHEWDAQG